MEFRINGTKWTIEEVDEATIKTKQSGWIKWQKGRKQIMKLYIR
jgi:hypothetical protein